MSDQVNTFGQMDEMFGTQESPLLAPREPRELMVVPVITEGPLGALERKNDLAIARETMHRVLGKSEDALDDLLKLARTGESARTFEVAGNFIKTMVDITDKLVDLHKKARELEGESEPETPKVQNIENQTNVFTGSTTDMLDMVKAARKQREKVINGDEIGD